VPVSPESDPPVPAERDRRALVIVSLLAIVGLAAAAAGFVALARGPVAVGWFAYAPLSDTVVVNQTWRAAPYLLAGGAFLIGGTAGWALARRRQRG
jgi:hypothetical protein